MEILEWEESQSEEVEGVRDGTGWSESGGDRRPPAREEMKVEHSNRSIKALFSGNDKGVYGPMDTSV
jgi:hypothetical protein